MSETAFPGTDPDLISVLRAIPDPRMGLGVSIPARTLLLVVVLGILSRWPGQVVTEGTWDRQPFRATHPHRFTRRTCRCDTSLPTTPEALLRLVRDRWNLEGWHWIRDTQLREDAHRNRGKGAGALASLRTAAMNLLRLDGFQSIRNGMQAVCRDIAALLAMARRQPGSESG